MALFVLGGITSVMYRWQEILLDYIGKDSWWRRHYAEAATSRICMNNGSSLLTVSQFLWWKAKNGLTEREEMAGFAASVLATMMGKEAQSLFWGYFWFMGGFAARENFFSFPLFDPFERWKLWHCPSCFVICVEISRLLTEAPALPKHSLGVEYRQLDWPYMLVV
jgi:hypothetical protein